MIITPFKSVGELSFTDTRQTLRDKVGGTYQPGENDFEGFREYYDFFPERDLLIYFNDADQVNAFEFFSADPVFKGIDMLSETYGTLLEQFLVLDPDLIMEESGFDSALFGIGVHAPDSEDDEDIAESVIVYRKGYYDD